ncbi:MAG: 3'-5' exonuclease [Candidatus Sulfotelmatobacter sp.]
MKDGIAQPFTRNLLVLDVETTGSDPQLHEVVEIGAVLLDADSLEPLRQFQSLVRPEQFQNSDPRALRIHGLSPERLGTAPPAGEVISRFVDEFGLDFIFCGWNIAFDTQFLRSLFRKAEKKALFDAIDYHKVDLWSLLELAWVSGLYPKEPKSLAEVCQTLHIERSALHNALQDALIAAEVLRAAIPMFRMRNDENIRFSRPFAADNV